MPPSRHALVLAVLAVAATPLAAPSPAAAQAYASYGPDPCHVARREAGNNGAVTGGILGAVAGGALAGRGSRLGGALVGGAVGAVAGHEIAKNSVKCVAYPGRYRNHRSGCRWVEERYHGRWHGFEVCRGPDGVWRPSGRS